jgi:hypothetical protein
MKTLIAVVNCRTRGHWREALRRTWVPKVPKEKADVFFFVGRGDVNYAEPDTVELDCSDLYEHLPEKVRAIARWALKNKYSYMTKIDDDVLLSPTAFLDSGFQQYKYSGKSNRPESSYAIPCGFQYTMDKVCMEIVAETPLPSDGSLDDEKWVAYNLSQKEIYLHDEKRLYLHQWQLPDPEPISRRPLRAPKRPVIEVASPHRQEPGTFSWCVHICAEQDVKIREYYRLYQKYGEK